MWDLTIQSHNPPPLGARRPRRHNSGQGLALIPNCHIPAQGPYHIPGPLDSIRSTILSALGLPYALTVLFLGTHTRTSQWVTHHGIALVRYSLNFGVLTEPEASELPKGLVLGRDENIHIRITPLGDVGSYNPPPLGARRPRRHTSGQGLAMIPNCHIPDPLHHCSTILSALGPDYALTGFCFWELTRELPSGSPIMGVLSRATRLSSKFPWNPKPVSSQKASC